MPVGMLQSIQLHYTNYHKPLQPSAWLKKAGKDNTMKQSVNAYDFERAFALAGRKDQFSYDGKKALFEYLEEYEDGTGEEIELDVIALCCDYSEYESAVEWAKDYGHELSSHMSREYGYDVDEDEQEEAALEYLRDHTSVIEFDTSIIIQSF